MSSVGTEFKLSVNIEPIDGYSMDDYDFSCRWYVYGNRCIVADKADMIRANKDSYYALVDSSIIGSGNIRVEVTAHIPDTDFPKGYRIEKAIVHTGEIITR